MEAMSIWSSIGVDDIYAINLDDDDTDQYHGTGHANVFVDVATARPWHDRIRLSFDADQDLHACVLLSRDNATLLRDYLTAALRAESPT